MRDPRTQMIARITAANTHTRATRWSGRELVDRNEWLCATRCAGQDADRATAFRTECRPFDIRGTAVVAVDRFHLALPHMRDPHRLHEGSHLRDPPDPSPGEGSWSDGVSQQPLSHRSSIVQNAPTRSSPSRACATGNGTTVSAAAKLASCPVCAGLGRRIAREAGGRAQPVSRRGRWRTRRAPEPTRSETHSRCAGHIGS